LSYVLILEVIGFSFQRLLVFDSYEKTKKPKNTNQQSEWCQH